MSNVNEKANEFYQKLEIKDSVLNEISKYLNEEIDEFKLETRNTFDFSKLDIYDKRVLNIYLKELFRTNDVYIIKHLRLGIKFGEFSLLPIISLYTGFYTANSIEKFIKYKIPDEYIIKWCLDGIDIEDFKIKLFFINYFDTLFENNENIFNIVKDNLDEYSKYYLVSFLINKNVKKYKKKKLWLEKEIKNKIIILFKQVVFLSDEYESNFLKYVIKNYLEGNEFINDNVLIDVFKNIDKSTVDIKYLSYYLGLAYLCMDQSEVFRKIIKLLVIFDFNLTYTFLHDILTMSDGDENEIKSSIDKISILNDKLMLQKEEFLSWIGNRLARLDYYEPYNLYIEKEIKEDRFLLERAEQLSDELGSSYLRSMHIKKSIQLLEANYLTLLDKIFENLEISDVIIKDYMKFLKGEKEFSLIQGILNELKGVFFEDILEYLKILRGLYWIKDISNLYNRTIKFFSEAGQYDLVCEITRKNIHNLDQKGIKEFINILINSKVSNNKILDFVVTNSNENYNKEWRIYFEENYLNKENILTEYLNSCDDYNKVYLLEEMFKYNKKEYAELLVNYIKNSTIEIRQKISELLGSYRESFDLVKPLLFVKEELIRESAVNVFSYWNDEEAVNCLKSALEAEKDTNIRRLINHILNEIQYME